MSRGARRIGQAAKWGLRGDMQATWRALHLTGFDFCTSFRPPVCSAWVRLRNMSKLSPLAIALTARW